MIEVDDPRGKLLQLECELQGRKEDLEDAQSTNAALTRLHCLTKDELIDARKKMIDVCIKCHVYPVSYSNTHTMTQQFN